MRLHSGLIFSLALTFSAAASATPDTDLQRAANKGNGDAVAAALKAGANVNARFDIGRTPLMIAARRGHVQIVEALLDAGADIYARDINGQDALMIAVEYEQLAVVRTLINRGFDPALNDWRALKIIPSNQKSDKASPKQREIRQFLEERRAKGPVPSLASAAPAPPSATPTAAAAPADDRAPCRRCPERHRATSTASAAPSTPAVETRDGAPAVVVDVSGQKITPEMFKIAAARALARRGWQITSNENNRLVGTLTKDTTYKAAVAFNAPMIIISYEKGYGSPKQNWLLNLRKDLLVELSALTVAQ